MVDVQRIIEDELFIACGFMDTAQFINFCKDRSVQVTRSELELLEKEKIFYPIARVEHPKVKEKICAIKSGKFIQSFGLLREGEEWNGELKDTYGHFWWAKDIATDFYNAGMLWSPKGRLFVAWDTFYDTELHWTKIESFYSPFQIYHLNYLISLLRISISALDWAPYDLEHVNKEARFIAEWSKKATRTSLEARERFEKIVDACVTISNRYYFLTQGDRRTITITKNSNYHNWNWDDFCWEWNPQETLQKLGLSLQEVKNAHREIKVGARSIDPLCDWYSLVQFVSLDEKKRLKGKALLAHTLYSMEKMIRLFYRDLTGEQLFPPDEDSYHWKEKFYGEGVLDSEIEYLELLTNQYHLNPRPKLILVVEGESEYESFPKIARALGHSLPSSGIMIESLYGIAEFSGRKGELGGKLARFIDHYHRLQTIVYVILDNEGRSGTIRDRLLKTKSKYRDVPRYVTNPEYVFLWDKNFEFDNFTDEELSIALNLLCECKDLIKPSDVNQCREVFGKKGNPLANLFKEKTGLGLSKPKLAQLLINKLIDDLKNRSRECIERKMFQKIDEITKLAFENYQPITKGTWLKNQMGGYFGKLHS